MANSPLLSSQWQSQTILGDPPNGLMPFDASGNWQLLTQVPVANGLGTAPQGPSLIVGVSLSHNIIRGDGSEWALIGHWCNGRSGADCMIRTQGCESKVIMFPQGQQPEYYPGDFFDVHAHANTNYNYVYVTIYHVPM